jgi:hypothetical protein
MGNAGEFDVFGVKGGIGFGGSLDLLFVLSPDHVGIVFVAQASGTVIPVLLKL